MKLWTWKKENLPSISHAFRTAVAATLSVLTARLVGLPEAYWAAIATSVVMQSPLSSTVPLTIERIVGSALGASLGAIESTYFGPNLTAFAVAIFLLGLISFALRLEKVGYGYARDYLSNYRPYSSPGRAVECCGALLCRSLNRNSHGSRRRGCVARRAIFR